MAFVLICPEKSLQLGTDEVLHREGNEQFIAEFLAAAQLGGPSSRKVMASLPGGGIAVDAQGALPKIAQEGPFVCAITGSIQNYAYLVKKYLQEELGLPANVTLEAIKERSPITETVLLCKMYSLLGTGMLSKLRGHFSFCLYDSITVRVLAARDPSGAVPLYESHLDNGALIMTSSKALVGNLECSPIVEIQPGNYKYGWRAPARKYTNPETVVKSTAQVASRAALAALTGIAKKSPSTPAASTRRASFDATRVDIKKSAEEIRRQSMDCHKMNSRADEHGWWRSKDDIPNSEGSSRASSSSDTNRKSNRQNRKSSRKQGTKEENTAKTYITKEDKMQVAEEFINQLGGAFFEDSASVRMLRSLLYCSPCSLAVTDALRKDHPIVFVNSSFESQTGYKSADILGKNCRFMQTLPTGDRVPSRSSRSIHRALAAGQSISTRILNYKKDGTAMWNNLSVVPLRNSDGIITHHVGMQTFSDVNAPLRESVQPSLGGTHRGIVRSRSCSDVLSMTGGQATSVAASIAF
uniref:Putative LOV domain-containing protein n=1 Tax=Codium fragile TaxID=3133 RepID=A0A126WXF0_CODFR|nr:putative LOV domain-containing protein [Codium fragile]